MDGSTSDLKDTFLNSINSVTFTIPANNDEHFEENIRIDVELMEMYIQQFNTSINMYTRFLSSRYITDEKRGEYQIQLQRLNVAFENLKTKIREYNTAYKIVKPDNNLPSDLITQTLELAGGRKRKKRTRRLRNTLRRNRRTHAVK